MYNKSLYSYKTASR